MFEFLGIIFGGVSRLTQHFMEMKDKQKEREHEAIMFDKQIIIQSQKIAAEKDLRQMDIDSTKDLKEIDLLMSGINAQVEESKNAGGFIAKLSASVRPVISYWLLTIYTTSKVAGLYLLLTMNNISLAEAIRASYTEFDGAMLGSIVSFWFADRSLRKVNK